MLQNSTRRDKHPEGVPASLSKARQREIFSYISRTNGPDDDRRAHPTLLKVDYADLVPALPPLLRALDQQAAIAQEYRACIGHSLPVMSHLK